MDLEQHFEAVFATKKPDCTHSCATERINDAKRAIGTYKGTSFMVVSRFFYCTLNWEGDRPEFREALVTTRSSVALPIC